MSELPLSILAPLTVVMGYAVYEIAVALLEWAWPKPSYWGK